MQLVAVKRTEAKVVGVKVFEEKREDAKRIDGELMGAKLIDVVSDVKLIIVKTCGREAGVELICVKLIDVNLLARYRRE